MKAINHLLFSKNRPIFSTIENEWNRVILQDISFEWKDKVKTTVKGKIEKFS